LTEKNENYNQRNDRLKETREFYLRKAIKDYKTLNIETDKQVKCVKEDVLKEMKNLWNFQKQLDDELIGTFIVLKINQLIKKNYYFYYRFENTNKTKRK
jgi:hypothetical protein